jgi:hypothetical protein
MCKMAVKHVSFGKLHYIGWIVLTAINTFIVFNEERKSRMMLLGIVVVLQFATFLFFIVDYEKVARLQWQKKEESLKKKLGLNL